MNPSALPPSRPGNDSPSSPVPIGESLPGASSSGIPHLFPQESAQKVINVVRAIGDTVESMRPRIDSFDKRLDGFKSDLAISKQKAEQSAKDLSEATIKINNLTHKSTELNARIERINATISDQVQKKCSNLGKCLLCPTICCIIGGSAMFAVSQTVLAPLSLGCTCASVVGSGAGGCGIGGVFSCGCFTFRESAPVVPQNMVRN